MTSSSAPADASAPARPSAPADAARSRSERCPLHHAYMPLDPAELADPYPTYAAARAEAPVMRSDQLGLWFISRHGDVVSAIRDTATFSSEFAAGGPRLADRLAVALPEELAAARAGGTFDDSRFLLTTDAPAHHLRRKLAQQAFTPSRVAALEPMIAARTEALCDAIGDGEVELMGAFAYPLTTFVIAAILGVGDSLAGEMRQVAEDLLVTQAADRHDLDATAAAEMLGRLERISAMHAALVGELAERRSAPRDDLLSALATTSLPDGSRLADADVLAITAELILAGTDTTANQIAHCVLHASADRPLWRSLAADRTRTVAVIEESLRRRGSSKGLLRITTRDVEVGGTTIPRGAVVQLLYGSANHDESVFPEPGEFQLDRPGIERHLAFGRGTHYCLGAPLARLELRVAVQALSRHFPELSVAEQELRYLPALTTHTLAGLAVKPGARG